MRFCNCSKSHLAQAVKEGFAIDILICFLVADHCRWFPPAFADAFLRRKISGCEARSQAAPGRAEAAVPGSREIEDPKHSSATVESRQPGILPNQLPKTSLRRNIPPNPTSPSPNILKVPGSGTASGVLPTLMCPIP